MTIKIRLIIMFLLVIMLSASLVLSFNFVKKLSDESRNDQNILVELQNHLGNESRVMVSMVVDSLNRYPGLYQDAIELTNASYEKVQNIEYIRDLSEDISLDLDTVDNIIELLRTSTDTLLGRFKTLVTESGLSNSGSSLFANIAQTSTNLGGVQLWQIAQFSNELNNTIFIYEVSSKKLLDIYSSIDESVIKRSNALYLVSMAVNSVYLLFVVIFMFAIIRRINFSIDRIAESVDQISGRNLGIPIFIKGKDELAQVGADLERLRREFVKSLSIANNMSTDSVKVGHDLSTITQQTAAAVTEISGNIGSMGLQVQKVSDGLNASAENNEMVNSTVENLDEVFHQTRRAFQENAQLISNLIFSFNKISDLSLERKGQAEKLGEQSKARIQDLREMVQNIQQVEDTSRNMGTILNGINEIAEETSILSMNAAIQAARAGDAGKGFSVVADEIRGLALSTGKQAQTMQELMQGILNSVGEVSSSSRATEESFLEIQREIDVLVQTFSEIGSSVLQMTGTVKDVNASIAEVDDLSTSAVEKSEEMRDSTKQVTDEIQQLKQVGQEMNNGFTEISLSINEITDAMTAIAELNNGLQDKAGDLDRTISLFELPDENESADEADGNLSGTSVGKNDGKIEGGIASAPQSETELEQDPKSRENENEKEDEDLAELDLEDEILQ